MKLPDLKQVRQVRLLPVVILAAAALFALKGFGLMTTGGYVLTGPSEAQAAGARSGKPTAAAEPEATLEMPLEPTMTDTSPVLDDLAPTLPLAAEGGAPDAGEGGDAAGETDIPAAEREATEGESADSNAMAAGEAGACPPLGAVVEGDVPEECLPKAGSEGDAPLIRDRVGNELALGSDSEKAILERLAARRDELDGREAELEIRLALVEAAEKRIEERTMVLEALEARINAMVDEKRSLEEAQFVAVVAMYETMKPKDAAAILDQLEMPVLLRVARAINPRKMAPIMAKMDPTKAMQLTAGLAVDRVEPTIELTEEDLTSLPQIVGQ